MKSSNRPEKLAAGIGLGMVSLVGVIVFGSILAGIVWALIIH